MDARGIADSIAGSVAASFYIGDFAFDTCPALTRATLLASFGHIGEDVFGDSSNAMARALDGSRRCYFTPFLFCLDKRQSYVTI